MQNIKFKNIYVFLNSKYIAYIIFLLVVVIYLLVSFFKVSQFNISHLDPNDDTALFWTEASFQYRYARMVAQGEKIPTTDYAAQYPEGVKPFEEFTLCMELVTGYLYRLFFSKTQIPFHIFLIYCIAFYSSLSVFAVYLLSKEVWRNSLSAILSVFFYIICKAHWARTVLGFSYEDFAFPFIFISLFLFIRSCRVEQQTIKNNIFSIFSGLSLLTALSSWHFTRFYFLVFTTVIGLYYFLHYYEDIQIYILMRSLLIVAVFCLLGGILIPVLYSKQFLFSLPMLICYSLFFVTLLKLRFHYGRLKSLLCFVLFIAVSLGITASIFQKNLSDYAHVYLLFIHKLLFLGQKPANPGLIPFDARVLWVSGFDNVPVKDLVWFLSVLLPLGVVAILIMFIDLFKRRNSLSLEIFLYIGISFLFLNLMIQRLTTFSAVFLSVCISKYLENFSQRKILTRYIIVGFLASSFLLASQFSAKVSQLFTSRKIALASIYEPDKKQIVNWIKENTQPNDVFLTGFGTGPLVLTDTGRFINLHPKFESKQIRDKFKHFLSALYNSEEKFYDLCKQFKVNYFLYQINFLFDSTQEYYRYFANKMKIEKNSVVYKFHFEPETLRFFSLVYQLNSFRVYKVTNKKEATSKYHASYNPIFDISLFDSKSENNIFDDTKVDEVFPKITHQINLAGQGIENVKKDNHEKAYNFFMQALALDIPNPVVYFYIGNLFLYTNQFDKAIENYKYALEIDNNMGEAYANLSSAYIKKHMYWKALKYIQKAISLDPLNSDNYSTMGIIFLQQRKLKEAKVYFEKAINLDPKNNFAIEYYKKVIKEYNKLEK
jgi:tetratricopeptide (TPR) repeat protein